MDPCRSNSSLWATQELEKLPSSLASLTKNSMIIVNPLLELPFWQKNTHSLTVRPSNFTYKIHNTDLGHCGTVKIQINRSYLLSIGKDSLMCIRYNFPEKLLSNEEMGVRVAGKWSERYSFGSGWQQNW